jgi:hypothetical protein
MYLAKGIFTKLMTIEIKRYSLDKLEISNGVLNVNHEGQKTSLSFKDSLIEVKAEDFYHPLIALEKLRIILETEYNSVLGCNGCRIDTSYRPTGGYITYKIESGKQAKVRLNIFEPTNRVDKLGTVDEHNESYKVWLDSL